jgi:hypothetical protein
MGISAVYQANGSVPRYLMTIRSSAAGSRSQMIGQSSLWPNSARQRAGAEQGRGTRRCDQGARARRAGAVLLDWLVTGWSVLQCWPSLELVTSSWLNLLFET